MRQYIDLLAAFYEHITIYCHECVCVLARERVTRRLLPPIQYSLYICLHFDIAVYFVAVSLSISFFLSFAVRCSCGVCMLYICRFTFRPPISIVVAVVVSFHCLVLKFGHCFVGNLFESIHSHFQVICISIFLCFCLFAFSLSDFNV